MRRGKPVAIAIKVFARYVYKIIVSVVLITTSVASEGLLPSITYASQTIFKVVN